MNSLLLFLFFLIYFNFFFCLCFDVEIFLGALVTHMAATEIFGLFALMELCGLPGSWPENNCMHLPCILCFIGNTKQQFEREKKKQKKIQN